eukprot:m.154343 g.154343  ORF g.154343 m.154343 type:complete len:1541 (-) comp15082_c0_seq1:2172-6794(-)
MGRRRSNQAIKKSGNVGGSKGTKEEVKARLQAIKDGVEYKPPTSDTAASATSQKSKKPNRFTADKDLDDDLVQFGNPKPKKKKEPTENSSSASANQGKGPARAGDAGSSNAATGNSSTSSASAASGVGADKKQEEEEAVPLITSGYDLNKWTGKKPDNLLRDYCRKSNLWKPNFYVHPKSNGFTCKISIKDENSNTTCGDPTRIYSTELEAKNFAAVLTLHRFNWNKPMRMLIPPGFRDYWDTLEDKRKEDLEVKKKKGWDIIDKPDPFGTVAASMRKTREEEKRKRDRERESKISQEMPVVRISENLRTLIESVLDPADMKAPDADAADDTASLQPALIKLGFNKKHILEALEHVQSKDAALDWLCLHVPEQDLPEKFRPSVAQIEASKHSTESLAREYKLKRLASFGFNRRDCDLALKESAENELLALKKILFKLWDFDIQEKETEYDDIPIEECKEALQEELESLGDILGNDMQHENNGDDGEFISIKIPNIKKHRDIVLEVRVSASSKYPYEVPLATLASETLPSHVRLSAIRQMGPVCKDAISGPVIYELFTWVQENLESILSEPPPLATLKTYAPLAEPSYTTNDKGHDQRKQGKRKLQSRTNNPELGNKLKSERELLESNKQFMKRLEQRKRLPAGGFRERIVETVRKHSVVVISGETGCGKTTQVPQFVLEDHIARGEGGACNMICTQPRRLSAVAVANRVAVERMESIGDVVGYSVRLQTKASNRTRLLFCTTGILLQRLQKDPLLQDISHVFVDEVHERSVDSDVLLTLARDIIKKRPDFRLILMSATIDADRFSNYFYGAPVFEIPGFTHPVNVHYLDEIIPLTGYQFWKNRGKRKEKGIKIAEEAPTPDTTKKVSTKMTAAQATKGESEDEEKEVSDWEDHDNDEDETEPKDKGECQTKDDGGDNGNAMKEKSNEQEIDLNKPQSGTLTSDGTQIDTNLLKLVLTHIIHKEDPGAILVFVAGLLDIKRCLRAVNELQDDVDIHLRGLPLHSSLTPAEQNAIFEKEQPGERKIVIATNVAETSITIDDVVHVVDSGRVKETGYDADNGMSCLKETWISKASARQRKGRAGRVQAGHCWRLYFETLYEKMADHQAPEILRVPLEQLYLRINIMTPQVQEYLASMLDAPPTPSVQIARNVLQQLNAVDDKGHVTTLGRYLADIPVDVRIGKFLIFASMLGCVRPALTIAGCLSSTRSVFVSPMNARDEAKRAHLQYCTSKSDLLTCAAAYDAWRDIAGFCASCDKDYKNEGKLRAVFCEACNVTLCNACMEAEHSARGETKAHAASLRPMRTPSYSRREREREEYRFCDSNFLSRQSLLEMRQLRTQFTDVIIDLGFMKRNNHAPQNINSQDHRIVKAALCAGLYPRVVKVRHPQTTYHKMKHGAVANENVARQLQLFVFDDQNPSSRGKRVFLHPSSINFDEGSYDTSLLIYNEKVSTSKVFLRDATMVSALPLLIFGGEIAVDHERGWLTLGKEKWIRIQAPAREAVLVRHLRRGVDRILEAKIRDPSIQLHNVPVIQAITKLLSLDGA